MWSVHQPPSSLPLPEASPPKAPPPPAIPSTVHHPPTWLLEGPWVAMASRMLNSTASARSTCCGLITPSGVLRVASTYSWIHACIARKSKSQLCHISLTIHAVVARESCVIVFGAMWSGASLEHKPASQGSAAQVNAAGGACFGHRLQGGQHTAFRFCSRVLHSGLAWQGKGGSWALGQDPGSPRASAIVSLPADWRRHRRTSAAVQRQDKQRRHHHV